MVSCNGSVVGGRPLQENNGGWDRLEPNCPDDSVGDLCGVKNAEIIRILTQNINGIGQNKSSLKEKNL